VKIVIFICALGLVVGAVLWFQPREYVSTSVLRPRTPDPQVLHEAEQYALSDFTVSSIIERQNLYPEERKRTGTRGAIRKMREEGIRIQESDNLGPVIVLSFIYSDARKTQAAVRELATALQSAMPCEVLVDASKPVVAHRY
jgi:hypothetical protein